MFPVGNGDKTGRRSFPSTQAGPRKRQTVVSVAGPICRGKTKLAPPYTGFVVMGVDSIPD